MLHGVIPVWKPVGMTSHDVVARVRRLAGQKRVGHTGTLDPDVAGVLPICLGQATRIVEYIQKAPKRYRGLLTLGVSTDTQDASGEVLSRVEAGTVQPEEVDAVFHRFVGEIEQLPPMYSAVKVQGRRLYEWAREGKKVARKPRRTVIYRLERTGWDPGTHPEVSFDVVCSKGTYVRTLCVDIGKALGFPAHMSHLIRVESGPFTKSDSFSLEEIEEISEKGNWGDILVGPGEALGEFPSLFLPGEAYSQVMNGMPLEWADPLPSSPYHGRFRVYTEAGDFCGLYRMVDETTAHPEKVFRVR
ncbi:tRNA pseudouridine(55) synthase TruB [Paludifilum halophilum]|nr:tRNA pseudouridine(55) synthase TruB [Paludifilum halophilum]